MFHDARGYARDRAFAGWNPLWRLHIIGKWEYVRRSAENVLAARQLEVTT
jgi:hypothetical protein